MASCVAATAVLGRIMVLEWAGVLAEYAWWFLILFLTDEWELDVTVAATIVNIWMGVSEVLPIGMALLAESFTGDFTVLLLSSFAYAIGLGLLSLSSRTAAHSCTGYIDGCIDTKPKALFITALVSMAVGISGHTSSVSYFLEVQIGKMKNENNYNRCCRNLLQKSGDIVIAILGAIALPYIPSWSHLFGILSICMIAANLLFLSGRSSYHKPISQEESPLTTVLRVFIASASKMFLDCPPENQLYEKEQDDNIRHTDALRWLDKAAIVVPTQPLEEQEQHRWKLCRVTEVEQAKIVVRSIPISGTLVICSFVSAIGNTYFVEQASTMETDVGLWEVHYQLLIILYSSAKYLWIRLFFKVAKSSFRGGARKYFAPFGITVAMVFAVLCCITAAKVEARRLKLVDNSGDKPDRRIPMTMFWLVPQYILLSGLDGILLRSIHTLFEYEAPSSMAGYSYSFDSGVIGAGRLLSILSVYIVRKITKWFQRTLDQSRLDNYYWILAALSGVNLVIYVLVVWRYPFKEPTKEKWDGDKSADGRLGRLRRIVRRLGDLCFTAYC